MSRRTPKRLPMTPTVAAITRLHITGTIVPHAFYTRPELANVTSRGSVPYLLAIVILCEIIYWYRAYQLVDESTGKLRGLYRKFWADKLQRSVGAWAAQYGHSKKVTQEALRHLRDRGLITLEMRDMLIKGEWHYNVAYWEPVVPAIETLLRAYAIVEVEETDEEDEDEDFSIEQPEVRSMGPWAQRTGRETYTVVNQRTRNGEWSDAMDVWCWVPEDFKNEKKTEEERAREKAAKVFLGPVRDLQGRKGQASSPSSSEAPKVIAASDRGTTEMGGRVDPISVVGSSPNGDHGTAELGGTNTETSSMTSSKNSEEEVTGGKGTRDAQRSSSDTAREDEHQTTVTLARGTDTAALRAVGADAPNATPTRSSQDHPTTPQRGGSIQPTSTEDVPGAARARLAQLFNGCTERHKGKDGQWKPGYLAELGRGAVSRDGWLTLSVTRIETLKEWAQARLRSLQADNQHGHFHTLLAEALDKEVLGTPVDAPPPAPTAERTDDTPSTPREWQLGDRVWSVRDKLPGTITEVTPSRFVFTPDDQNFGESNISRVDGVPMDKKLARLDPQTNRPAQDTPSRPTTITPSQMYEVPAVQSLWASRLEDRVVTVVAVDAEMVEVHTGHKFRLDRFHSMFEAR